MSNIGLRFRDLKFLYGGTTIFLATGHTGNNIIKYIFQELFYFSIVMIDEYINNRMGTHCQWEPRAEKLY